MKTTSSNNQPSRSSRADRKTNATAIQAMSIEHRYIETVVKSLADAAAALEKRRPLNVQKLRTVVEFLRVYADQRHHVREETWFFPILTKRGVPARGCPIDGLNHEHEKGRALVSALEEQTAFYAQRQPESDQALRQTLLEITRLYRHHLWMEDAMVFPMAEKLISENDSRELMEKFADLDRIIGQDVIARLEQFAGSLSFQAGTTDRGCDYSRKAGDDAILNHTNITTKKKYDYATEQKFN